MQTFIGIIQRVWNKNDFCDIWVYIIQYIEGDSVFIWNKSWNPVKTPRFPSVSFKLNMVTSFIITSQA